MKIAVPRDAYPGETRVSLIPEHVAKLVKAGAEVSIESGLGKTLRIVDDQYAEAGATVVADRNTLIEEADMILRIRKPLPEEVDRMKAASIYISLLDPFNERELIEQFLATFVDFVLRIVAELLIIDCYHRVLLW